MERGVVRSSARLSGGGGGSSTNGNGAAASSRAEAARRAAAAALAAERRARAAERAREVEDSPRVLRDKCRVLARAVRSAKHLVVYTGAGISTAADIPDYRGPRGVWTRLQRGEDIGRVEVSRAQPTFTHMALTALVARGLVKFVVSQNCDGLHLRSGLPRRALAELHGDMFAERCAGPRCRRVVLRAFDTTQRTRRHAHGTRRTCPAPRCGRPLRDTIVHFGERARAAWPLNWAGALRHAAAADVILCLGSSLKVLRRYPGLWSMARPARQRPRLYIVNLQWTPKDAAAALKINARCDAVMRELARRLRLRVPRYRPARDPLLAHATPLAPAELHTCSRPALPPPPLADSGTETDADSTPPSRSGDDDSTTSDSDDALPLRRLQERLRLRRAEPDPVLENGGSPFPVDAEYGSFEPFKLESKPKTKPVPENGCSLFPVDVELRSLESINFESKPDTKPMPENGCSTIPVDGELSSFEPIKFESKPVPDNGYSPVPVDGELRYFGLNMLSKTETKPVPDNGYSPIPVRGELRSHEPIKPESKPVLENGARSTPVDGELRSFEVALVSGAARILLRAEHAPRPRPPGPARPKEQEDEGGGGGGALRLGLGLGRERQAAERAAAAFIARAVLACRARLYPGLHEIVGEAAGGCAWCARHYAARRCLWYAALEPAAPGRVWRRARGRRYLCTCCPRDERDARDAPSADEAGEGGWYGKGYRKGRRRRR